VKLLNAVEFWMLVVPAPAGKASVMYGGAANWPAETGAIHV